MNIFNCTSGKNVIVLFIFTTIYHAKLPHNDPNQNFETRKCNDINQPIQVIKNVIVFFFDSFEYIPYYKCFPILGPNVSSVGQRRPVASNFVPGGQVNYLNKKLHIVWVLLQQTVI